MGQSTTSTLHCETWTALRTRFYTDTITFKLTEPRKIILAKFTLLHTGIR